MQKFDTPAAVTAHLDIPAGRIQLIAADRADTTVEVRPTDPAKSRDVKAAERTEVVYADGVLRVEVPAAGSRVIGPSGSIEVTVQLPSGSRVQAKTASGELRGVGRLGDVVFEGQQATVKIDETADARLATAAGDIAVGRLGGPAEISTQKGDIRIDEATRGAVVLRTESGHITISAAHGVSASLDAGTPSGRIRNALKNTDGTPELAIHATTGHGDISADSL
ncbi:DUF4097 family beta strand repeat-containing protein [Streptomyces sp. NPDC048297]|uniref:DUF4097 family beta strand repeat-containing protein n=1 Tax=Streptomyces sp. NPDC048297 TaxID=3365531 RepID=UPI00371DF8C9